MLIQRSQTAIESARRKFAKTVYSLSEMRNHITFCAQKQQACVIELGADIALDDHGFVFPDSIPFMLIDGNNKQFTLSQNVTGFIDVRAGTALTLAPLHLINVSYNKDQGHTSTYFVYDTTLLAHINLVMRGCYVGGCTTVLNLLRADYSNISDNILITTSSPVELVGATNLRDSIVGGNAGNFSIAISATDSVGNVFLGNLPDSVTNSYSVTSFKRNTWVGTYSNNLTWSKYDNVVGGVYTDPAAVTIKPTTISVTADNQSINTDAKSLIFLASDNATPANRTITLTAGQNGQMLTLLVVSNAVELADSGTCNLSAIWQPGVGDTLQLVYSTTTATWCELCRSNN